MKSRKIRVKIVLSDYFKNAIYCAKRGYKNQANESLSEIIGAIRYMWLVGDISETERIRIQNLTHLIRRKYNIY